jgi:hypothetical protein
MIITIPGGAIICFGEEALLGLLLFDPPNAFDIEFAKDLMPYCLQNGFKSCESTEVKATQNLRVIDCETRDIIIAPAACQLPCSYNRCVWQ